MFYRCAVTWGMGHESTQPSDGCTDKEFDLSFIQASQAEAVVHPTHIKMQFGQSNSFSNNP